MTQTNVDVCRLFLAANASAKGVASFQHLVLVIVLQAKVESIAYAVATGV